VGARWWCGVKATKAAATAEAPPTTAKPKRRQSPFVERRNAARARVRRDRIVLLMREHGEPMTLAQIQEMPTRGLHKSMIARDLVVLLNEQRVVCYDEPSDPKALFLLRCA